MNTYTAGSVVRITATWSFDVDSDVYFEVTGLGEISPITVQYGTPSGGLEIVRDGGDNKICYVDVDTFDALGTVEYWFYARGTNKAAAKSSFIVT